MKEDCIFCKIIRKEIPAQVVYEDDRTIVFKDINPKAPVHLLIVPKKHVEAYEDGFANYDAEILGALFHAADQAAEIAGVRSSGYRLIVNSGPDSGQEVAHLHMHLLGGRKLGALVGE
jgi:histidine triad (HIT) family protein